MPKNKPQFKPLHDFVLIKPFSEKETKEIEQKKTGITLPEAREKKGRAVWGTVIAVGPGKLSNENTFITPTVDIGDVVILSEYDGYEMRLEGDSYMIVREDFIFTTFQKNG